MNEWPSSTRQNVKSRKSGEDQIWYFKFFCTLLINKGKMINERLIICDLIVLFDGIGWMQWSSLVEWNTGLSDCSHIKQSFAIIYYDNLSLNTTTIYNSFSEERYVWKELHRFSHIIIKWEASIFPKIAPCRLEPSTKTWTLGQSPEREKLSIKFLV